MRQTGHVAANPGYDVIGDVHGHADELVDLLAHMGYEQTGGVWSHQTRQAVFVGDLIDRGPKQIETVTIVRRMVDAGTAQMVIGNHEFNALAFATPDGDGGYLRPHSEKNSSQHHAFLDAVGFGSSLHREILDWFMTIPMWLDLGGLRVVHACWSIEHIEYLADVAGPNANLTEELLVAANTRDHPSFDAVEVVLKGPEVDLRGHHYVLDGRPREHARIRWWKRDATTLASAAVIPEGVRVFAGEEVAGALPDAPLDDGERVTYDATVPVVYGHYWWSARRGMESDLAACVDYSVAEDGELVAYRWDGEQRLSEDKITRAS